MPSSTIAICLHIILLSGHSDHWLAVRRQTKKWKTYIFHPILKTKLLSKCQSQQLKYLQYKFDETKTISSSLSLVALTKIYQKTIVDIAIGNSFTTFTKMVIKVWKYEWKLGIVVPLVKVFYRSKVFARW